ncbi:Uncharacterized protein CTYZ_00002277 [Cryptosporidium tyzzeri]|nr:Uncharacterized protein CTYZ_00002277 [Cryptosporidium tyzzeri]
MSIKKFRSLLTTLVLILFLFNYEHYEQETINRVVPHYSFLNLRAPSCSSLLSCFGLGNKPKGDRVKDPSQSPPPKRSCLKKPEAKQRSGGNPGPKKKVRFKF